MSEEKNTELIDVSDLGNEDELFSFHKLDDTASEVIAAPEYSYWGSVFRTFFSSKVAIFMMILFLFIVLMAIFQPMVSGYDHMNNEAINDHSKWYQPPSAKHWFGTDDVGRDMFSIVWSGARTSLFVAFIATIIELTVGILIGMWWGFSKNVDVVMIEVYNVIANVPFVLLVMVLSFALGSGIWQLIFALSVTTWVGTAYFVRVQVMIIRDREYNLASKCLGTKTSKIIRNNIFPYLISVLIMIASRDIPAFISTEVFLSYLSIGLPMTIPSLGRVVQNNAKHIDSAPYLFFIPLIVTSLISISLYIVGQTLGDASDPRNHMV